MRPMKILWILLLIMLSQGAFAREALKRYALLVGNNYGGRERVTLKYSLTDARAMGKVLQELGGVEKEDLYLLAEPSKKKIERVLAEMKERVAGAREQYERIELLFYYSGHSDIQGLLIGQENLDYAFIRKAIKAIPADLKVAVLDSCASGAITRLKGGVKRPPFMVDSSMRMKGYAFITSSSHDEASQESDRIKGSFFTYYFLSGLRGAADLSQDGRVTLNEVYQYAFHETLSRTEKTVSGAQHPGYEIQMSGSGDVVLTDLRKTSVLLIFDKELSGRISIRNSGGVFVAEVAKVPGKEVQLSLEADRYEVLLEKEQKVYGTTLTLSKGREVFDVSKMVPVQISKNAGKGDEYVLVPWSFALLPSVSTGSVEGKKVIHNYSFNLVADYSDRFYGFAMGTVNFVGEDAEGFLFGFGGNYIKGSSSGFQLAGTLNYVGGEFSGFQLSGMLNYVKKDMDGFQLGPLNVGGRSRGSQIGVVNVSEDFQGFQTGLVNVAEDVDGAQVGLVNVADKVSGVQIGLVNIADENEVPIGLVNIIKNGRLNLAFWYDSAGFWNLGLKMGGKYFYSLLVLGTSLDTERQLDAVGLGGYIPLYGNLYLELDALYQTYYPLGKYSKELELDLEGDVDIFTARLSLGFEVLKGFKIFGGLSMPLVYTNHEGRNGIIPRVKSGGLGDVLQMSEWFFGIEIF